MGRCLQKWTFFFFVLVGCGYSAKSQGPLPACSPPGAQFCPCTRELEGATGPHPSMDIVQRK
jgi:hypothetical protein